jgi:peptidoglycan/xylan/chitin deacetylase (PgdA/CDA1 family)
MEHLKELAETPGVTIGAHSHGHELLDQIPLQQARSSMARSRELLQDWTGQEVRHFAFPNGNHTQALRDIAGELGFVSATILEERTAPRGVDPFALPRISVGRYDSRNRVRLRLVGL